MASNSSLGAALGGEGTADKLPGRSLATPPSTREEESNFRVYITACFFLSLLVVAMLREAVVHAVVASGLQAASPRLQLVFEACPRALMHVCVRR